MRLSLTMREVKGPNELNGQWYKIKFDCIEQVKDASTACVKFIRSGMRAPKHGRLYRLRGRWYQASAPGEMPAIRTSKLYGRIRSRKSGETSYVIRVPKTVPYGEMLENGTVKMMARPFMAPAYLYLLKYLRAKFPGKLRKYK